MNVDETIDRILKGERNEFRHLTKMCNQSLYRVAIVFLRNRVEAEDALQLTYLKAFVHLHTFRRESSFLTWTTRILINECKMMVRRRKTSVPLDDPNQFKAVMNLPIKDEDVMNSMDKKEITRLIELCVQSLPEKYKLVYLFREVNEISTEETAIALGLSEPNVKVRLHRAKSMLRESIAQHIPSSDLFPFGNEHCQLLTDRVLKAIQSLPIVQWS